MWSTYSIKKNLMKSSCRIVLNNGLQSKKATFWLRPKCDHRVGWRHKPADKITDDIGMTHDDLEAVLLLLGVSTVDVAAEGCLNASAVFVVLLEDGREVESHLCHMEGFWLNPPVSTESIHDIAVHCRECMKSFPSKMRPTIWKCSPKSLISCESQMSENGCEQLHCSLWEILVVTFTLMFQLFFRSKPLLNKMFTRGVDRIVTLIILFHGLAATMFWARF